MPEQIDLLLQAYKRRLIMSEDGGGSGADAHRGADDSEFRLQPMEYSSLGSLLGR